MTYCYSLHTSKNKQGLDFSESYPSFDSTIMKAYSEFLDSKYCKSLFVENKDTDQALDKLNEDSSAVWEKIGSDEGNNLDGMEDGMDNDNDNGDGEDDGDDDGPCYDHVQLRVLSGHSGHITALQLNSGRASLTLVTVAQIYLR